MRLKASHPLRKIAKTYKVRGISFGGCVEGKALGFKGAMRRSAHAHCHKSKNIKSTWYRWICVKSSKVEKLLQENGKPNHLFWHEVAHIYRRSFTQKKCDEWADQMLQSF